MSQEKDWATWVGTAQLKGLFQIVTNFTFANKIIFRERCIMYYMQRMMLKTIIKGVAKLT